VGRLKLGVLGARRGANIVASAGEIENIEFTAFCDMDADRVARAAEDTGVRQTYTRYEDLLASDVDAVLLASPMPLHVEQAVQALEAGKHVLSEVTAATSIEQCWQLVETVQASGRTYMLAENYCYIPAFQLLMGMARAGLFGELYYGEADQLQHFKGSFKESEIDTNWRTAELAMRQGHQYITHNLGPLYQIMRERVATVSCMGSGQHYLPWAKADDTCVVICQTTGGKLIRIRLDFFSNRPTNYTYFGIQGTGGCYEGPRSERDFHKVYIEGECEPGTWRGLAEFVDHMPADFPTAVDPATWDRYNAGESAMLEAFARSILRGEPSPIDVYDAVNMTAPGILSELSAQRRGEPVDVPDFRERSG